MTVISVAPVSGHSFTIYLNACSHPEQNEKVKLTGEKHLLANKKALWSFTYFKLKGNTCTVALTHYY